MNPFRDPSARGPLSRRAVPSAVCGAVLTLLAIGSASATGPTTITFAEHPGGTLIDTEYASQGVRFGKASDVGAPALAGAWDCGAPQVKELTSDGPAVKLAQAPLCGGRSGTVVAFANPRKSIRLVVAATPSTTRNAQVMAYNRAGALVTQSAAAASFQAVTIERPSPDVAFLAVQLSGEGTSAMLFDDLQFDHLGDPLTLEQRGVGAAVGVERTDNVARLTDADPTATAADYAVTIGPDPSAGAQASQAQRASATKAAGDLPSLDSPIRLTVTAATATAAEGVLRARGATFSVKITGNRARFLIANPGGLSGEEHPFAALLPDELKQAGVEVIALRVP